VVSEHVVSAEQVAILQAPVDVPSWQIHGKPEGGHSLHIPYMFRESNDLVQICSGNYVACHEGNEKSVRIFPEDLC